MSAKPEPTQVRVGQVWKDGDPRSPNRHLLVVELPPAAPAMSGHPAERQMVRMALCNRRGQTIVVGGKATYTNARLDRFRPRQTGYLLVADVPEHQESS